MQTCFLYPAISSKDAADTLLETKKGDASFWQKWQPAYQAAFGPVDEDEDMSEGEAEPAGTLLLSSSERAEFEDDAEAPAGWRIDRGPWAAIPIGATPA